MFRKPLAHQSNATPLRSSTRRGLVNGIFEQYPSLRAESDGLSDSTSDADKAAAQDAVQRELGKVIVPDGVRQGTFETSGGVIGTMYLSPTGDPLWLTVGKASSQYIPTLNLLALDLSRPPLPILQIHHPIPPPLFNGAPLFLPAVRNLGRPHLIPDVHEGGLVSLVFMNSQNADKNVQYFAVGRIVASGGIRGAVERRMRNLQTGKDVDEGKFCDILCIVGDHLFNLGSKPVLKTFPLPAPTNPLAPPPDNETTAGPSKQSNPVDAPIEQLGDLSVNDAEEEPEVLKRKSTLSPSDISTLLSLALLQVLSTEEHLSFPMAASLLYSSYILPNRPAYISPEQRDEVVIGKSEWKKLTKWMKEASKEGILKIKEAKGEAIVQGYDAHHPSVETHAHFITIGQEEAKAAKRAAKQSTETNVAVVSGKGKGKELHIEELWKPMGVSASFWEACGVSKNDLQLSSQLKTLFDEYVTKNNLVSTKDHRLLKLDEVLGKAFGIKHLEPGETIQRDEALRRLRTGVAWSVSVDGAVKKGALQPISMAVKTRQGRKTVTLISGLETFGIDIDDFAEELKKLCAGSASIQPLTGASPKLNLQEIMVQGSQVKVVTEALLSKGVPKRWIKEAPGDKKKK